MVRVPTLALLCASANAFNPTSSTPSWLQSSTQSLEKAAAAPAAAAATSSMPAWLQSSAATLEKAAAKPAAPAAAAAAAAASTPLAPILETVRESTLETIRTAPSAWDQEADEAALFAASTYPIKPDALIARAKAVLGPDVGLGTKDGGACLAEDFEFCAAVVGPIGREAYLKALGSFQLEAAFPDLNARYHLFRVDPFQPNRVYFHSRTEATHTEPLMGKPATGTRLNLPPQCFHLDFDDAGDVLEVGFYVVDRRQGNTGGLGGAFAFFWGTGNPLPIPECRPYKPSRRFRFLNLLSTLAAKLKK